MNVSSNEEILNKVAANAELKKPLKDIYQAWPNLYAITLKLVDYMGDIIPARSGRPLLEVCLINAVNGFRSVSAHDYGTASQMVAYIRGLLIETPEVIKISLGTTADEPVLWDPFVQSVSAFQVTYPNIHQIYNYPYSDVKENSMRLMILSRIITVSDLYWIDQFDALPSLLGEAA